MGQVALLLGQAQQVFDLLRSGPDSRRLVTGQAWTAGRRPRTAAGEARGAPGLAAAGRGGGGEPGTAAGLGLAARTRLLLSAIVFLGFAFRIVSHSPLDQLRP